MFFIVKINTPWEERITINMRNVLHVLQVMTLHSGTDSIQNEQKTLTKH